MVLSLPHGRTIRRLTLRTFSMFIASAALVALTLTASSSPVEETLPSVPPAPVVSSNTQKPESEVVEMSTWHSTAAVPTVKKR